MKTSKILLLAFTSSLLAVSCTQKSAEEMKTELTQSIVKNAESKSLVEWEDSEHTPSKVFSGWRQAQVTSEEACKSLVLLSGKDLSLFEDEIQDESNGTIVQSCKEELQKKIDAYYAEEKKKMGLNDEQSEMFGVASSGRSAYFADNVSYRDMSQGYYAVRGDVGRKEVILTFDDGPHPQHTQSILNSLENVNAKAIFFALGKSVKANPGVLKLTADKGHMIGSHSVTHPCLAQNKRCDGSNMKSIGKRLSHADSVAQIRGGHQAVYDVLGWVAPFFRFPYGEASPNLKDYLRKSGVGEFYWNVDSNDWKNSSPQYVADDTLKQIDSRGGGVVLFHDVHRRTAEMLPYFLRKLHQKGYSVVLMKPSADGALYSSPLLK